MGGSYDTYARQNSACRFLVRRPKEREHLEDLGVDRRIILKGIFKKWDEEAWTGLLYLRIGTVGGRF